MKMNLSNSTSINNVSTIQADFGNLNRDILLYQLLDTKVGAQLTAIPTPDGLKLNLVAKNNAIISSIEVPQELPDYSSITNKYLYVNSDGNLEWTTLVDPQAMAKILYDTTATWDSQIYLVTEKSAIYIYIDKYSILENGKFKPVPGIKIGDGTTRLIDTPFINDFLGKLAYKDTAEGSYLAPTGSGHVNVPEINQETCALETAEISVVTETIAASKVSGGDTKEIAKVGSPVIYGNANVGSEITCVSNGVTTNVTDDGFLEFINANSITFNSATASETMLTPAEANGSLTGSYEVENVDAAKMPTEIVKVATGELKAGNQLISSVIITTKEAAVTVDTEEKSIVVS